MVKHNFTIGDRVKYSNKFLQQVKAPATDDVWFARGRIKRFVVVGTLIVAKIIWDGQTEESSCLVQNLSHERQPEYFR